MHVFIEFFTMIHSNEIGNDIASVQERKVSGEKKIIPW